MPFALASPVLRPLCDDNLPQGDLPKDTGILRTALSPETYEEDHVTGTRKREVLGEQPPGKWAAGQRSEDKLRAECERANSPAKPRWRT
jgi:hypothetical protein